jgi:transcription elongation factor
LETGSWIAIYLPMLVIFITMAQNDAMIKNKIARRHRRKELKPMTNELLQTYIGKRCRISSGSYATSAKGVIREVNDNWIEVETSQGRELINAEFVQSIKVLRDA